MIDYIPPPSDPIKQNTVVDYIVSVFTLLLAFDYVLFIESYFHAIILVLGVIYWTLRIIEMITGNLISCWIRRKFLKRGEDETAKD